MRKIAVLGCGWLGFPLAISLIKNGHIITGTTTSVSKISTLSEKGINAKIWSLNQPNLEEISIFLKNIEIVIINIPPSKIENYSEKIQKIISFIPIKSKVIFVSTTSVYPDDILEANEEYVFTEQDALKKVVQVEINLQEILSDRLTIIRLAGLIGPNRHPINQLSNKKEIPNGDANVNLIHLNDAIGLIEKIITDNYWGEIVNGCFPEHPTKIDYYSKMATVYNKSMPHFLTGGKNKKVSSQKSLLKLNYTYTTSIF